MEKKFPKKNYAGSGFDAEQIIITMLIMLTTIKWGREKKNEGKPVLSCKKRYIK